MTICWNVRHRHYKSTLCPIKRTGTRTTFVSYTTQQYVVKKSRTISDCVVREHRSVRNGRRSRCFAISTLGVVRYRPKRYSCRHVDNIGPSETTNVNGPDDAGNESMKAFYNIVWLDLPRPPVRTPAGWTYRIWNRTPNAVRRVFRSVVGCVHASLRAYATRIRVMISLASFDFPVYELGHVDMICAYCSAIKLHRRQCLVFTRA